MFGSAVVEGVFEEHVLIEGIVFGRCLLLGHRIVDGRAELGLFGQEAAEVGLDGHIVLLVVVEAALVETLVDGTEAGTLHMRSNVEGGDIAHIEGGVGLESIAAGLVEVGHFKLVDPHDGILGGGGVVADAY